MNEEPEQDALFTIEGPDERGCVWIYSSVDHSPAWSANLGPAGKVAPVLSQWLGSLDYDEIENA